MKRFIGKVAIVTGGGNGIGAAIAERLSDEGASVLIVDRELDAAKENKQNPYSTSKRNNSGSRTYRKAF